MPDVGVKSFGGRGAGDAAVNSRCPPAGVCRPIRSCPAIPHIITFLVSPVDLLFTNKDRSIE